MKRMLSLLLAALLLTGCGAGAVQEPKTAPYPELVQDMTEEIPYESRFDTETVIVLSDGGITVNGGGETDSVYTSHDIIYYEEKTAYASGCPYGEGSGADMHSAQEADEHTVVNITAPGAYRVSGKLSAGQIRIDLGEDACEDESAVVELILDNADITCTVAPAVLFLNVYECDGAWSVDTAQAVVDTSAAGANLILEGENTVSGAYVAKIFKDQEGEKKLWKQDGAIYSYMSMNVFGPGSLDLTAANEGLDTELHLTINGGSIAIRSGNDGINTNEDGVSVTTINAGSLHIIAGLGEEGDGIDSNGFLVINGGTVVASANPAADAGLDSDMGSFINGGTVVALGSAMDWAESDSDQVTMNLQFASFQSGSSAIVVTQDNGTVVFAYDPGEDELLGSNTRRYRGAVISCANLVQGCSYHVFTDGSVAGSETGGVYDVAAGAAYSGGTRMMYTATDVMQIFGSVEGSAPGVLPGTPGPQHSGEAPDQRGENFSIPEGETPPGGFRPDRDFEGEPPEDPTGPEGESPQHPDGETMPEGFDPGGMGGAAGVGKTLFHMQDKVNFFSGLTAETE